MAINQANSKDPLVPESVTQQSIDQGTGTPSSPVGASVVSRVTNKQQDAVGTPNQQKNAQNLREQNAIEQNPDASLSNRQRTDKKINQTPADQAAKEKAQTLASMGPVRSRVQALIEQRVQDVSAQQTQLEINDAQIQALPAEFQVAARAALETYKNDLDIATGLPKEANAQTFYDILEQANMGAQASLSGGGINNYLANQSDVIGGAAQGALEGAVNLGEMDITQLGTSYEDLASALGVPVEQVMSMSLDDLDSAIDAVEANELNRYEQIQAKLADSRLPPAQKQQLLDELNQLSGQGVTGAEQAVDLLDEQITAAGQIDIGGETMSLEKALGDEGISRTIANAVDDPDFLEDLKGVPGYEALAGWIETNRDSLKELTGELEDSTEDFLTTQNTYTELKGSLKDEQLLSDLFPDIDFSGSILSGDLEERMATIEADTGYQFLKASPKYAGLAANKPELLEDIRAVSQFLDAGQIEDVFNDMERISGFGDEEGDKTLAALVGGDLPKSIEEYNTLQDNMTRYEELNPDIMTTDIQNMAQNGELGLDDLEAIGASPVPKAVVANIVDSKRISTKWDEDILTSNDPGAMIDTKLFGSTGYSARDVTWAIQHSDEETAGLLLDIFDDNEDGKISDEEAANIDPDRAKGAVGLGGSTESLIASGGKWSFDDVIKKLEGKVVDGKFEQGARLEISTRLNEEAEGFTEKLDIETKKLDKMSPDITIRDYDVLRKSRDTIDRFEKSERLLSGLINTYGDKGKLTANKTNSYNAYISTRNKYGQGSPQADAAMAQYKKANDALVKYDKSGAESKKNQARADIQKYTDQITTTLVSTKVPSVAEINSMMSAMSDIGQINAKILKNTNSVKNLNSLSEEELAKMMG